MEIERIVKYGTEVWANTKTDELRKTDCLCLNCKIIDDCSTAKKLYQICKEDDMAMMITRCKNYSSSSKE